MSLESSRSVKLRPRRNHYDSDRLDLLEFSLDPGSTEVTPCDRDAVEILSSGVSDLRLGKLCGENGGQHIYLDILNQQTQPMLRVMTDARGGVSGNNNLTMAYRYNIKATQIDCTAPDLEAMMMIRGELDMAVVYG